MHVCLEGRYRPCLLCQIQTYTRVNVTLSGSSTWLPTELSQPHPLPHQFTQRAQSAPPPSPSVHTKSSVSPNPFPTSSHKELSQPQPLPHQFTQSAQSAPTPSPSVHTQREQSAPPHSPSLQTKTAVNPTHFPIMSHTNFSNV